MIRTTLYGAFELKRVYQRNLLFGALVSGMIPGLIVLFISILSSPAETVAIPVPPPGGGDTLKPIGTTIHITGGRTRPRPNVSTPDHGVFRPVDDALFDEFIDSTDLDELGPTEHFDGIEGENPFDSDGGGFGDVSSVSRAAGGGGLGREYDLRFDTVDVAPVMVVEVKPEYPYLARVNNVSAVVWIKALIDRRGKVHEALVESCDAPGYGFEEATLKAIRHCAFSPALINRRPVAMWVLVPFEFRVR